MQELLKEVSGQVWRKPSVLAPLSYEDAVLEVHEVAERLAAVLLVLCSALLLFGMWHCLSCLAEQTCWDIICLLTCQLWFAAPFNLCWWNFPCSFYLLPAAPSHDWGN